MSFAIMKNIIPPLTIAGVKMHKGMLKGIQCWKNLKINREKKMKKKSIIWLTIIVWICLLLTACGGSSDVEGQIESSTTASETATEVSSEAESTDADSGYAGKSKGKKLTADSDEKDDPEEDGNDDEEYSGPDAYGDGELKGSLDYLNTTFYGVWVSAGIDYDKLYDLADDFAADGFDDCLVVSTADFENLSDKVPYCLTVGKFDTEDDADKRLEEVKKFGYPDAYVKNTGAYLSDNYYYVTSTLGGFDIDEQKGEIWIKDVEVQFPYRTGYEQSGASTVMTLYLDKDTVFVPNDPSNAGFANYQKGETPYDWFVKNYELSEEDPDENYDAMMALRGVFEVGINGNYIESYTGSYWWD